MPLVLDYIDPGRTAVIVVDMQNDFVSPDGALETPMGRDILPNLKRLLDHARKTGMRVIFTTHVHRRDGSDMGLFGEIWPRSRAAPGWWTASPASRFTRKSRRRRTSR